jgi:hypothetical protein
MEQLTMPHHYDCISDRPTYTAADRRRALEVADRIGLNPAARQLGIHPSTLRTWAMRERRGDLPAPVLQLVTASDISRAPTPAELRRRWDERGSYQPTELLTGRQLLDRIWNLERTSA